MKPDMVTVLTAKDDKYACAFADKIISESRETDEWYELFEEFASLLNHPKSLVRNRALTILAANAQWDDENRFDAVIEDYLPHITDEKPITARQCVKALAQIGQAKPKYIPMILAALRSADLSKYKDSMRPLIERDIQSTMEVLTDRNLVEAAMTIRALNKKEIEEALPLVWEVFCRYEAVNYPADGKAAFWRAIHAKEYLAMLSAFGAYDRDRLVGILATRNAGAHIALFFVDGAYQRRGVGRKLLDACLEKNDNSRITVHSSEYAVEIYRRLGFVATGEMQEDGGIRYLPMVLAR